MWKEIEGAGLIHVPTSIGSIATKMPEQLEEFRLDIKEHFSRRVVQPWDHSQGEPPSLEPLEMRYLHCWGISRFGCSKSQATWSGFHDSPTLNTNLDKGPAGSCQHGATGLLGFLWSTKYLSVCLFQNLLFWHSVCSGVDSPVSLEIEISLW